MKYAAQAYVGLVWLSHLGTFDTQVEAMDALHDELARQFAIDETMTDEECDQYSETYYANSQITEVDE